MFGGVSGLLSLPQFFGECVDPGAANGRPPAFLARRVASFTAFFGSLAGSPGHASPWLRLGPVGTVNTSRRAALHYRRRSEMPLNLARA